MRPTGESLGEPYDVDELWPDEAELGSMLRSYYRKHPSPEVMAQHLFELRQVAEAEKASKAGARWVRTALIAGAAACLLLAAFIAIGPARSRTEANLDTDPADTSMAEREQDVIVPTPSTAAQGLSGDEQGPVVTGRIVSEAPATTPDSPAPSTPTTLATVSTTRAPESVPASVPAAASQTSEAGELSAAPAGPTSSPQSTAMPVSSTTKPANPTAGQQAASGQPSTTVATPKPPTTLQASTQPVLTRLPATPTSQPVTSQPPTTAATTTTRLTTTAAPTTTAPPTTTTTPPTTTPPTTPPPTTSPPTTSPPTTRPPLICTLPIIGNILCFF
ncbi:MAG: hypothetical protein ACRBK7_03925 [Acidimicrobiales bacterium]